jgi:hypothetical protein
MYGILSNFRLSNLFEKHIDRMSPDFNVWLTNCR